MGAGDLARVWLIRGAAWIGTAEGGIIYIELYAFDHGLCSLLSGTVLLGCSSLSQLLLGSTGTSFKNGPCLCMMLSLGGLCNLIHESGVVGLLLSKAVETEQTELLESYGLAFLNTDSGGCGNPVLTCSCQGPFLVGDHFL